MDTPFSPIDVEAFEIAENHCDLGRDLHLFLVYVREREVKRSHRQNSLSKGDAGRLAKLMSDPSGPGEVKGQGYASWVDYVDSLALKLGFVSYDTEGIYQGYTSTEPSYPDNYIRYKRGAHDKFLSSSLQEQERRIADTLLDSYSYNGNEFFQRTPFSILDAFDQHGCGIGVLPGLDFSKARRFLFQVLQAGEAGAWYSTDALIRYLKARHPFFLIPRNPKIEKSYGRPGRYGNFHENRGKRWDNKTDISEALADAFERVEGRFVEHFLEGIPLTLGYVDVAYGEEREAGLFPSLGRLRAFRIRPRLLRFMAGEISPPRVTVQPNFEIHVESEAYPARLLDTLRGLAEVVTEDTVTILKLQKKKVAARLAEDASLDVVVLLRGLSQRGLPRNVVTELEEWGGHAEAFTLYTGFGLLEGDSDLAVAEEAVVERISPTLCIVSGPGELFTRLEEAELAPLSIRHGKDVLRPLPKSACSVFPKVSERPPKPERRKASLKRRVRVSLEFPSDELLETFREGLAQARCALEVDRPGRTISFPKSCEGQVRAIVKGLKDEYQIRFEELDGL